MQRKRGPTVAALGAVLGSMLLSACGGAATAGGVQPGIEVDVTPKNALVQPSASVAYAAAVAGSANTAVTWSVTPAGSGAIDAAGRFTAPASTGTFQVVATSVADPGVSGSTQVVVQNGGLATGILPADRETVWNPGVQGIPARTTVCATLDAATFGNGAQNATNGIQAAVDACPVGQVVQLGPGAFTINGGSIIQIDKGITLRGAGAGVTILQKTDGAKPGQEATGPNPSPIIIVGPSRWSPVPNAAGVASSTNLTLDGAKGSRSVTVASAAGLTPGQMVLLDELSKAGWRTDPAGRGQIWASADWRVVWQLHNPSQGTDDPLTAGTTTGGDAAGWFSRADRPTAEVKEIASVAGNVVTFTTPLHISYRVANAAQVSRYDSRVTFVQNAGVEKLTVIGGDNGNIRFQWAARCWAKNVENTVWHDEGFALDNVFRIEIRDSYIHDAAWAQPGGAGYAISFSTGSSDSLVENSIILKANKVMVARCAGAGSVIGYNYVDNGYINTATSWIEVGLNGSHMVGSHHMLFEGNYGFNWDSDKTHGNAIYHTIFRNHLRGVRRDFGDTVASGHGPLRCGGATYYSYWHSFVGNVLGAAGQMAGWVYESNGIDGSAIWKLGWDDWAPYPVDAQVIATTIRDGNWDFVTNSVHWASAPKTLPPSFYLAAKPAFFGANAWPWVDPLTGATTTLPAKARYDGGTPNVVP